MQTLQRIQFTKTVTLVAAFKRYCCFLLLEWKAYTFPKLGEKPRGVWNCEFHPNGPDWARGDKAKKTKKKARKKDQWSLDVAFRYTNLNLEFLDVLKKKQGEI